MKKLNKEQKVARRLHHINELFGILAFIPAFICWLITIDAILNENNSDVFYFTCSSILLLIFYTYIFRCPCIYKIENYDRDVSLGYWIRVLITNLLTALLFISADIAMMTIIPAVPFVLSVIGLKAHYHEKLLTTDVYDNNK
jgi:hypothetical protein